MLRAAILLIIAFLVVGWFVGGTRGIAQPTKDRKTADYYQLFDDVSGILKEAYLDLDRVNPQDLLRRAFSALETSVDEIYVNNSVETDPYVALYVDSKAQVYDLATVKTLEGAVAKLEDAFAFLARNYRGETELNDMRYAAVNGFLSGLDPHTMVFSPEAFRDFSVHIEGEIYGVGMYVGSRDGKLMVIEVLKDTPAAKAGFRKGDRIEKIGDESTINMTVTEAVDKIRGSLKSWVTLTVKRPKAPGSEELEALEIPVQRDRVVIKSVESALIKGWNPDSSGPWKGGVGYVKIINFDKNTTPSLREHLMRLEEQNGSQPLVGLILDLRGNSGGLLTQAVEMSDLFLKSGTIVITANRGGLMDVQKARSDGSEPGYPMVVLSEEASASGAEIVIGALQKNNRAVVLGTRTFGKGSVQQLHRLRYEAQLKITVSEYLLPGEVSIQENGVVPNIYARPVLLTDGDYDLFPNERSMTEKDYDQHIVSRYAKKEVPSYTVDYDFEPPEEDLFNDSFMSGDLQPEKDKLVIMALDILKLSGSPFDPARMLSDERSALDKLKDRFFEEIVRKLGEKGIDWSYPDGASPDVDPASLELELASEIVQEPSGDKDDPVPVNKLVVKARLTNKGPKAIHRMKGQSRSEYFLYKDQEFLFGKVDPGQTVERSVKVRLPYFPYARNDVFNVEVSCVPDPPGWESNDKVLASRSLAVELAERGRPAFAYSAELLDVTTPGAERPVTSLKDGVDARLRLKIRNTGTAPVYRGIAVLRNETGRQIFLKKGRIEFPERIAKVVAGGGASGEAPRGGPRAGPVDSPEDAPAVPPGDGQAADLKPAGADASAAAEGPPPQLKPGDETEIEFEFGVRQGESVESYEFELAIADSYSNVTLLKKLSIPRVDKEALKPFPNGVEFAQPSIAAQVLDPEANAPVKVTNRDRLRLSAKVASGHDDPFKVWIYNSLVGDKEMPDKVYYADSRGEPSMTIATEVLVKKGTNFFTVVAKDRDGVESRESVFVRRE